MELNKRENLSHLIKLIELHPALFSIEKSYDSLEILMNGMFRGISILLEKDLSKLFQVYINKSYNLQYYNMFWSGVILHGLADNDKSKAWDIFFENIYDFIDQLPEEE